MKSYKNLSIDKKVVLKNFCSLSILQIVNYLLPLLLIPYLVQKLGIELFGLISFASATILYFNIIVDYGFNLSATQQVSINRNRLEKLKEIFTSVIIAKSILLIVSFLCLLILLYLFDKFSSYSELYLITFGTVVGQMLFPIWLFQGLEKMKMITYLNVISKVFFTVLIFLFVNEKDDYLLVPLFTSLGYLIVGIYSIHYINSNLKITFVLISVNKIKYCFIDSWHLFLSNVSTNLYTTSSVFVVGLFTNNTIVGYYSIAEKVIRAFISILKPFYQALYPHIMKKLHESGKNEINLILKISFFISIINIIIGIIVFIYCEYIVMILFNINNIFIVELLQIFSILPFIIGLNNIIGVQAMLGFGYKKEFSNILIVSGLVGILVFLLVVNYFGAKGVAISYVMIEFMIMLTMCSFLFKKLNRKYNE